MNSKIIFQMFFIAITVQLFLSQPALADVRSITCNSRDSQYQYCRVDTDNEVRLTRQLSSTYCEEGRTWGYDRNGVWVDKGCRAEFSVGRSDYRDYNERNYGHTPAPENNDCRNWDYKHQRPCPPGLINIDCRSTCESSTAPQRPKNDCTSWDYQRNKPCPPGYINRDCKGDCRRM